MAARSTRAAAALARIVLRIFYREISVVVAERIPLGVPLIVVANHPNGLVDCGLIAGFLPVRVRFLAKSTLWTNYAVRPLLVLGAAVPVYRRQDAGVDPMRNAETFVRCHEILAAGGALAIFPEGHSHGGGLRPLKSGAARVVLDAEGKPWAARVRIVPVHIAFETKDRPHSRVRLYVGDPVDPTPEIHRAASDRAAAVRALTGRMRESLLHLATTACPWGDPTPAVEGGRRARWRRLCLWPVAALGVAIHGAACVAAAVAARATRREEMRASCALVTALYVVPAFCLFEIVGAAWLGGRWAAGVLMLAALAGGPAALRWGRQRAAARPSRPDHGTASLTAGGAVPPRVGHAHGLGG